MKASDLLLLEKYEIPLECNRCPSTIEHDLQLHHKNRNPKDNRKKNLEVLCFNCHKLDHGKKLGKHGRYANPSSDPHIKISLSISKKLLKKVENEISGDSRSQKIANCVSLGYLQLTTAISEEISESE